jgi:TetR/AcrR family transcriptional repressor of mexJK operon
MFRAMRAAATKVSGMRDTMIRSADMPRTPKELEILEVAAGYFLSHGYKGTSINAMARDAGISKESIYRYFSSKRLLFQAVIAKELAAYKSRLEFLDSEPESLQLRDALIRVAETILMLVCNERTLALRRLIFQEVGKTPDIGSYYYAIGPNEAYDFLERIFSLNADAACLSPAQLARNFVALTLHYTLLRRECGVMEPLTIQQSKKLAADGVDEFLQVYLP